MRVLVIPDIHLKPWMFIRASELLKEDLADRAVCLMDIADDWGQGLNIDLYISTYDTAVQFAEDHPETLWCFGNHDVSYLWELPESGYSQLVEWPVCERLRKLAETLRDPSQLAFLHRIDDVLFSHAGLAEDYVAKYMTSECSDDIDAVVTAINDLDHRCLWQDLSPIWFRPQYSGRKMYKQGELLQVVGHTPMRQIEEKDGVVSCDVFSTHSDGTPIGTQEFLILDTVSWEYRCIQ
jgi:hypothetical protein